jgi:hypothetical protein
MPRKRPRAQRRGKLRDEPRIVLAAPDIGAGCRNAPVTFLGPTIPTSDTGVVVAELDDVRARLLDTIDDVLKVRPSASKRIMELALAYESLSQSSPPRPNVP